MKKVIVSGYFNPLHGGHLDMIEAAKGIGDYLIVIVNNDVQAVVKKGKIILNEANRLRLMQALQDVDEAILSIDVDSGQALTLQEIRKKYPKDELIFANGGDRNPDKQDLPSDEKQACKDCNIQTIFGIGSHEVEKRDSSTRINQALGKEKL